MNICEILKYMENEDVVIVDKDSFLYQGKVDTVPFWLTKSVVYHIWSAGGETMLKVVVLNTFAKEEIFVGNSI